MKDWVLLFIVLLIIAIDTIIILVGSIFPQSRLTSFEVAERGNSQEINVRSRLLLEHLNRLHLSTCRMRAKYRTISFWFAIPEL